MRGMARLAKPLVFAVLLAPALYLALELWRAFTGLPHALGEEPVEYLEHATGALAIRTLVATLAVTPLRQLTGWNGLARYRRMLGLFAFFYASLHLATYAALDLELNVGELATEIVKRPYILVGFSAWLLLVPLAATSTTGSIRRLGGRRWNRLHRATYAVAVLAVVHFWWGVKKDVTEPLIYALVVAGLLGGRAWRARVRRRAEGRPVVVP